MKTVIDTSSLISLARIQYLEIIEKLKLEVVMPEEVYTEAVKIGGTKGYTDAIIIENFIKKYNIETIEVENKYRKVLRGKINKVLSAGDEAVLALAIIEKVKAIIANDDGLGRIAFTLGFIVQASPDLLLEGLKKKILNYEKYETFMRGLVIENRLSSAVAELYLLEGKKYVKR
jgi:predicted nucleic acid-binding protein